MWQIYFAAFSFHEVIKLSFAAGLPVDCHYLLLWRRHQTECCHLAVLVSALAWDRMDWQWNLITAAGRGGGVNQADLGDWSTSFWRNQLSTVRTPDSQGNGLLCRELAVSRWALLRMIRNGKEIGKSCAGSREEVAGEHVQLPPLKAATGVMFRSVNFDFFKLKINWINVSGGQLNVVWVTPCPTQAWGTVFRQHAFGAWSVA